TFTHVGSLSFAANSFIVSTTASESFIYIDYANGPASRSIAQTISGGWTFSNASNQFNSTLEIGTASISGGGINTRGGYTQTGTTANTFSGQSTFSAASTGLIVNNSASVSALFEVGSNIFYVGTSNVGIGTQNLTTDALEVVGNASISGDVRINGNDILGSDGVARVTFTDANTITLTAGTKTDLTGDLEVSGNDILDGSQNTRVTFDAAGTRLTGTASVSGNFEVGTNFFLVDQTNSRAGIGSVNLSEALELVGNASLSGDLRLNGSDIIDSGGTTRITIGANNLITGNASVSAAFEAGTRLIAVTASISQYDLPDKDGGLVPDCEATTNKLVYDSDTKRFDCGVDQNTGGSPKGISVREGTGTFTHVGSLSFAANSFIV
ncbi:MAG: hypothetical protein AAB799_01775, partial [Patescibacteria group bacterium]